MWTVWVLIGVAAGADYAKPGLLMEGAELAGVPQRYVVLDARSKAAYEVGHVPGAQRVDVDAWTKAMTAKQDAKAWGTRLGALGVQVDRPVIVYGLPKAVDPARVWWILRYWGVKDVRLVNGGFDAYKKAGGKVVKRSPDPTPTSPVLKAAGERLATKEQLLEELKAGKLGVLIDARTTAEHCGTRKTAKRAGAIPQAKHLDWADTLDMEGRFKTAPELAKLFKDAGIDPSKPATTYCQSGGRAAVMAFVVELMTGKPARNYYRSWAEWGNDPKTPIVQPKK